MPTNDTGKPPYGLRSAWNEWKRRWRDPVTLFTLLLVIVGALQYRILDRTNDTIRIQERAWLTPLGANIVPGDLKTGEAIRYSIVVANSGREPALNVNIRIQNRTIDSYDPKSTDMATVKVPENSACVDLKSRNGRFVIGPTGGTIGSAINYTSAHGDPYFVSDDKIVNGDKFYLINGCIAYETQGVQRRTSFCYILESQKIDVQVPGPIIANVQTQITQKKRVWYFATCASGFDAT